MLFIIFSFFSYQNLLVILPFKLLDLFLFYDNFWLDPDNLIESGKLGSGSGIELLRHSNTLFGDRIPPQIWTAHGCTRFTITVLSLHNWLIDWGKTFSFPGGAGRACWVDGADPVPRGGEEPADGLAARPQPPLSPHLWCEPQSAHRPWHRLLVHCLQILKVSVHLTIYSIFNYLRKISVAEPVRFWPAPVFFSPAPAPAPIKSRLWTIQKNFNNIRYRYLPTSLLEKMHLFY